MDREPSLETKKQQAMSTPSQEVVHAYRHLYRTLLQTVRYSAPARYLARDKLREAFRDPKATFDAEVAKRTHWFLEAASRERGLEHRIVKNLLRVESEKRAARTKTWRGALHESKAKPSLMSLEEATAFQHYEMTITMLNKSMGICLR